MSDILKRVWIKEPPSFHSYLGTPDNYEYGEENGGDYYVNAPGTIDSDGEKVINKVYTTFPSILKSGMRIKTGDWYQRVLDISEYSPDIPDLILAYEGDIPPGISITDGMYVMPDEDTLYITINCTEDGLYDKFWLKTDTSRLSPGNSGRTFGANWHVDDGGNVIYDELPTVWYSWMPGIVHGVLNGHEWECEAIQWGNQSEHIDVVPVFSYDDLPNPLVPGCCYRSSEMGNVLVEVTEIDENGTPIGRIYREFPSVIEEGMIGKFAGFMWHTESISLFGSGNISIIFDETDSFPSPMMRTFCGRMYGAIWEAQNKGTQSNPLYKPVFLEQPEILVPGMEGSWPSVDPTAKGSNVEWYVDNLGRQLYTMSWDADTSDGDYNEYWGGISQWRSGLNRPGTNANGLTEVWIKQPTKEGLGTRGYRANMYGEEDGGTWETHTGNNNTYYQVWTKAPDHLVEGMYGEEDGGSWEARVWPGRLDYYGNVITEGEIEKVWIDPPENLSLDMKGYVENVGCWTVHPFPRIFGNVPGLTVDEKTGERILYKMWNSATAVSLSNAPVGDFRWEDFFDPYLHKVLNYDLDDPDYCANYEKFEDKDPVFAVRQLVQGKSLDGTSYKKWLYFDYNNGFAKAIYNCFGFIYFEIPPSGRYVGLKIYINPTTLRVYKWSSSAEDNIETISVTVPAGSI